jgi:hypothetical protein
MADENLAARVEDLEEALAGLRTDYEATRDHVLEPRLEDLEGGRDDAREERAELQAEIQDLRSQVTHLEAKLESVVGLADDQQTSPDKRVADLRQGLIRRAEARAEDEPDKAAMHYREVRNFFAEHGHGEVSKPDCYKAMEDAADDAPGFSLGKKASPKGNQVKAVRVELDALRAEYRSRNPTTRETRSGAESAGPTSGGDTITTGIQTD